ncbi:PaaI family thioesterase [Desulfolucanica intricata]|uniref:PaaI family thioesterase n=1 Tax=Desulfolucanica intricata TaxID=1285191 RepID=UPI000833C5CF|nr:PaaI family thioesterase [Desulfolucanica intricata]
MSTVKIKDGLDSHLCEAIINFHNRNPFAQLLGIKLDILGKGFSRFTFQGTKEHTNPFSTIHGGVTAALGDVAMATALRTKGIQVVTAELTINYISPGTTDGELDVIAKAVNVGKTVCLAEFCVHHLDKNHLVATGRGIFVNRGPME